jgi:hypothetical protein
METRKYTLEADDPWADLFLTGTVLWRHVNFKLSKDMKKFRHELPQVNFDFTQKGNYLARMHIESEHMYEPEIFSPDLTHGLPDRSRGLVVFVDVEPPKDWTHVVVVGCSKAMRDSGCPSKGACVFAKAVEPYDLQEYLEFRKQLFLMKWRFQSGKEPIFENIVDASERIQISNMCEDELRLITRYRDQDKGPVMDFWHLKMEFEDEEGYEEIA